MTAALALLRFWREGIMAALGLLCLVLWLNGKAADQRAAKYQGQLAVANALIEQQNDAVEELQKKSAQTKANAEAAYQKAKLASRVQAKKAAELEAERPLSGQCLTPAEVMGAGL